jgi:hypothetical protein
MQETIPIQLESTQGCSVGEVRLRSVPREAALRKAIIGLVCCWGMALVTTLIPIVHFVAPPALFLIGPVLALVLFRFYNGATDIVAGGAACPACSAPIQLAGRDARWPLTVTCPKCQACMEARPPEPGRAGQASVWYAEQSDTKAPSRNG